MLPIWVAMFTAALFAAFLASDARLYGHIPYTTTAEAKATSLSLYHTCVVNYQKYNPTFIGTVTDAALNAQVAPPACRTGYTPNGQWSNAVTGMGGMIYTFSVNPLEDDQVRNSGYRLFSERWLVGIKDTATGRLRNFRTGQVQDILLPNLIPNESFVIMTAGDQVNIPPTPPGTPSCDDVCGIPYRYSGAPDGAGDISATGNAADGVGFRSARFIVNVNSCAATLVTYTGPYMPVCPP